jgi:tetrapyrrole methylase family protein/MazG family protein
MEAFAMSRATAAMEELVHIIERLRGPSGCPWDREQSAPSMVRFLIEEAYELADAIASGHVEHIREELGDVLFHILFITQMHSEKGQFDLEQVCREIGAKMKRRHPHVFGAVRVTDSAEVVRNWQEIKRGEKDAGSPGSALDAVPAGLPGLMRAYAVSERAARVRFDWEGLPGVLAKLQEELAEFTAAAERNDTAQAALEFGDILFTMVNVARFGGVHPETALGAAVQKFERRFRRMEAIVAGSGRDLASLPQTEKERIWEAVKSEERQL